MNPIIYSICIFLIISLLSSIVFSERIKNSDKKHIISGVYVLLAAFIHLCVLMGVELINN